jgi:membrane fusion protein (multidrug efflux system)
LLRSIVALIVVLLVGAAAAGVYWKLVEEPAREAAAAAAARPAGAPTAVEAAAVRIGPAETNVTAVGTLLSNESVTLEPEVSGRITDINFEEGKPVRRGEVLVELDDDVEKAELAQAEAALELAKANFQRASDLRKTSAGTQRAFDEAQAELRRAEAAVELAKSRFARRWVKAPFDGVVGLRQVSLGDYLNEGQAIANLEQINPLKVDFRIPEVFIGALDVNLPITVTVDAFPGEMFSGTVMAINPLVDEAGRSVVVRARIDNEGEKLRPGLFARVSVKLAERENALFVPESAILPQEGRNYVFKILPQAEGPPKVARVEVELGKRLRGEVEVTAGLEPDDRVVTAGAMKIRDGADIQVVEPGLAPAADSGAAGLGAKG